MRNTKQNREKFWNKFEQLVNLFEEYHAAQKEVSQSMKDELREALANAKNFRTDISKID